MFAWIFQSSHCLFRLSIVLRCCSCHILCLRCSPEMLLHLIVLLGAIHSPLLFAVAKISKIDTGNGVPPSKVPSTLSSSSRVDSSCSLNTLTSSTSRISSIPPAAVCGNRTFQHNSEGSVSLHGSTFRRPNNGNANASGNLSRYTQNSNMSSSRSAATGTVSNCSQTFSQNRPKLKCVCPQLQTTTVFVTVTATHYPSEANLGDGGPQMLPSAPVPSHTIALELSVQLLPSHGQLSSQVSSFPTALPGELYHHSVEKSSSPPNVSTQSAPFPNYPVGTISLTGFTIPPKPTMKISTLQINGPTIGNKGPEPGSMILVGTASTSLTPSERISRSTAAINTVGGSTISNPDPLSSSTSLQSGPGSIALGHTPYGQGPYPSGYNPFGGTTTPIATSNDSAGPMSRFSTQNASSPASSIQGIPDRLSTPPNRPFETSPPSAMLIPSLTTFIPQAILPASSSIIPSVIFSQRPDSQTLAIVSAPTHLVNPLVSSNSAIPTPPAMPSGYPVPSYSNISQALNPTISGPVKTRLDPPQRASFPTQGLHSSSRPLNGSSHSVMCFPNTTSITHIIANVRRAPVFNPPF